MPNFIPDFTDSSTQRPRVFCAQDRIGIYESLYIEQNCGPHHSNWGNPFVRINLTIMRRAGDHDAVAPSGVSAQSVFRMSSPISPPPVSQLEVSSPRLPVGGSTSALAETSLKSFAIAGISSVAIASFAR